ncbi:dephospho-CoA kinase [Aliikangiella marina]|uniref:Dephospho-CoA kinase n=1 Tax=Aliikangiella marina TaxID=1712262 RepID=A0A545T2E5_9GAMM|nr:dephospho-CoA kinase [Aliikangiella marina]TQV71379.1 dephospho-CoA kinase [Aliikangiella marina]
MLKIGLTGGIASGKSTVSGLFASRQITIIDADKIARDLFKADSPLLKDLRERFGDSIFIATGELDRKALGSIVFSSPEALKWLNDFTHPKVAAEIKKQLSQARSPYVILDIPLLIKEDGTIPLHLKQVIDRVLVVDVSEATQISRIISRDKVDRAHALRIINSQSTREQKLKLADDVIDNNLDLSHLESQVKLLHNHYLGLAKS